MDGKMSFTQTVLCHICLSTGKDITELTNEKDLEFYKNALRDITAEPSAVNPLVCQECSVALHSAMLFREKVKSGYILLQNYDEPNPDTCPLQIEVKPLQIEYINESQPRTVKDEGSEWTGNEVKQCKEEDSDDGLFHDDISLSFTKDKIISKKKKKKKRKKKESLNVDLKPKSEKSSDKDSKIKLIHLSYEDMMCERESDMRQEPFLSADFKCEGCIVWFKCKEDFEEHYNKKHTEKLGCYICPICKTTHANVNTFTIHYKRHTRRYECGICGERASDMKSMSVHTAETHDISLREYKCSKCGKISDSPNAHRYHIDTHKGRLSCKLCDKTFMHRSALKNHKISVHELNNKFPCDVCAKVFRWKTSLTRHMMSHHTDNRNQYVAYCELCNVSFTMISNYQRHLNTSLKHVSKDELRFICDHCNKRFSNKTKLRDHIEDKHLHKTYTCTVCNKVSKNRVALEQHIRNVHRRRPNNKICHHCAKGFPTKSQLESHIRMHTGERPFFCQYCPSTFSQQSNLYKHNRQVHLNLKAKKYSAMSKVEDKPSDTVLDTSYAIGFQYSPDLNTNLVI